MNTPRKITVVTREGKPVGTAALVDGLVVLQLPGVGEIAFTTEFLETVLSERLAGTSHAMYSATWPWVLAFARRMEAKLEANRHKGDREGWLSDRPRALFERLTEEVRELRLALRLDKPRWYERGEIDEVTAEAADVANFAMMIADVVGGLAPSAPIAKATED